MQEPAQPLSPSGTVLPEPAQPRPGNRAGLAAKLSVADLARVRQALALLSEDPTIAAGRTGAAGDGPVPSSGTAGQQAGADTVDDDADTFPMPVILPGAATPPLGGPEMQARGPFEPARPSQLGSAAETGPEELVPAEPAEIVLPAEPAESLPPAAAAKLDQIKDLLLTAEAIGERNLDQHFDQVSQRQRELIREFFNEAAPGRDEPV